MSDIFVASVVTKSLVLSTNYITFTCIEKIFSVQVETFQSAEGIIAVRTIFVETVILGIIVVAIPGALVIALAFQMTRISRKFS